MNMIQKRQQMKGQSGFTLIELLVAVAILGVLAGVAVFAVGGLTKDSKIQACKTEIDTIKTANAAANATGLLTDTYATFIPGTIKYFTVTVAPVAGDSNARTATAVLTSDGTAVADAQCAGFTATP
jgi:prepilin-type N-terminal cleavage/methylation domain-containing protein